MRSRHWAWGVAALGIALAATACNRQNVCGSYTETVVAIDGGAFACASNDDCPRPGDDFVCATDVPDYRPCVRCEEHACVRVVPEPCR